MSGPKVVRIVSVEEKQQVVKQQQRKIVKMLQTLHVFVQQHNLLAHSLIGQLQHRRKDYEALNEDDYYRIEAFAEQEIQFLKTRLQELEQELVKKRMHDKNRIRRIKMAAHSLKQAYQQREIALPETIATLITLSPESNSNADQLVKHEQQLKTALQALTQAAVQPSKTLSTEQQALKSRLQSDAAITSFSTWLTTYEPKPSKQQIRLDTLLTYLSLMPPMPLRHSQIQTFITRAEALEQGIQTTQFAVKMDSLIVDVSTFIQLQKHQKQQQEALQHYQETIESIEPENTSDMLQRIKQVLIILTKQTEREFDLDSFVQQAHDYVETLQNDHAADSRRHAVLTGLQALGYDINENMTTAWVENGRLIVKKSAVDDYGIELAAPSNMQRIQARVTVNNDAKQRSMTTDNAAEEAWCGDFSQLKQTLADDKGEIIIDRALAVGSQALKEIATEEWNETQERQVRYGRQVSQAKGKQKKI